MNSGNGFLGIFHSPLQDSKQRSYVVPGPRDVICGEKGTRTASYPGNRLFRQVILLNADKYGNAKSKLERICLVRSIVFCIREAGGRFIRRDDEVDRYYDIGDGEAREKTRHALRFLVSKSKKDSKSESSSAVANLRPSESIYSEVGLQKSSDGMTNVTQGDTNWMLAESIVTRADSLAHLYDHPSLDSPLRQQQPSGMGLERLPLPASLGTTAAQTSQSDMDRQMMLALQAEKLRSLEMMHPQTHFPSALLSSEQQSARRLDEARQRSALFSGMSDPILSANDELLLRREVLAQRLRFRSEDTLQSSFQHFGRLGSAAQLSPSQQGFDRPEVAARMPSYQGSSAPVHPSLQMNYRQMPSLQGHSAHMPSFQGMDSSDAGRMPSFQDMVGSSASQMSSLQDMGHSGPSLMSTFLQGTGMPGNVQMPSFQASGHSVGLQRPSLHDMELDALQRAIAQEPVPGVASAASTGSLSLPSTDAMMRARLLSRLNQAPTFANTSSAKGERHKAVERGTLQRGTSTPFSPGNFVNINNLTVNTVRNASNVVFAADQQGFGESVDFKQPSQGAEHDRQIVNEDYAKRDSREKAAQLKQNAIAENEQDDLERQDVPFAPVQKREQV